MSNHLHWMNRLHTPEHLLTHTMVKIVNHNFDQLAPLVQLVKDNTIGMGASV